MSASPFYAALGERIRAVRLAWGMSQAELARRIGVTFQQLQKYERGINRLSMELACRLSRIFGVPLDYWCTGNIMTPKRTRASRRRSSPQEGEGAVNESASQEFILPPLPEVLPEALKEALDHMPSPALRAVLETFAAVVMQMTPAPAVGEGGAESLNPHKS